MLTCMKKNFCSKIYVILCIIIYTNIGCAQTIHNKYDTIITLNVAYPQKIERIHKLIDAQREEVDSVQLSFIYNKLSKLNNKHKDYKNAIVNGTRAIKIQEKFAAKHPTELNRSYNNLAYFYLYAGDQINAITTFKKLIKQKHKDRYTIMAYAIGLTSLYVERGDYYRVLDYLNEARNTIKQSNDKELEKENYRIYLSFSRVYMKIGGKANFEKALTYLVQTETSITHLSIQNQIKKQIIIYNRYGDIYDELKQFDKAILYYNKALALSLSLTKINYEHIARIYNNIGLLHARKNDYDKAYLFYQKGLVYAPFETSIQDNLGDYYRHKKEYEKALMHYQKAICYSIEGYKEIHYNSLPDMATLIQSYDKIALVNDLKDKAKAWYEFYKATKNKSYLEQGLNTITIADKIVDIIRSESLEQQSKFFWRAKELDLYMLATSICYELNKPAKAFYFMEKSKSLSLLENLTHEEAKNKAGLPEEIREREYALRYEIYKTKETVKQEEALTIAQKKTLIFQEKKRYEAFLNSLEKEYPSYYEYKKKINITTYEESIQKGLSDNVSLIEYIVTDQEAYGIIITAEEKHFFKIPKVKLLHNQILELRKLLAKPLFSRKEQERYKELSIAIYQKLFPRGRTNLIANKKVVIIPDHFLQYLPFEALNIAERGKEEKYLIEIAEVSYLYSMSLLKSVEEKKRMPEYDLVGMAPIDFKTLAISDLKRSEPMMQELEKVYRGNMFFKKQASKRKFIEESNKYKIIHLATHASSLSNQEPWIAFYDDKLFLSELYFVKNQADLVILDACKTGTGKLQPGEGLMSLTRGFFYSGARSVISSLWNTNEKSSNEVLLKFYKYLKEGDQKATALRKAKLDYITTHQGSERSPYFWGALILTGNTTAITLQEKPTYYIWFVLIGIILVILIIKKAYLYKYK